MPLQIKSLSSQRFAASPSILGYLIMRKCILLAFVICFIVAPLVPEWENKFLIFKERYVGKIPLDAYCPNIELINEYLDLNQRCSVIHQQLLKKLQVSLVSGGREVKVADNDQFAKKRRAPGRRSKSAATE